MHLWSGRRRRSPSHKTQPWHLSSGAATTRCIGCLGQPGRPWRPPVHERATISGKTKTKKQRNTWTKQRARRLSSFLSGCLGQSDRWIVSAGPEHKLGLRSEHVEGGAWRERHHSQGHIGFEQAARLLYNSAPARHSRSTPSCRGGRSLAMSHSSVPIWRTLGRHEGRLGRVVGACR